ncbi:hypothetical protein GCM10017779_72150 [Streptomyces capillispiralis]|nr:hypothetical protein GCM10017779_72150 [Streptomyces capillispiralis]
MGDCPAGPAYEAARYDYDGLSVSVGDEVLGGFADEYLQLPSLAAGRTSPPLRVMGVGLCPAHVDGGELFGPFW